MSQKFSSYRARQSTHELAGQKSSFGLYSDLGMGVNPGGGGGWGEASPQFLEWGDEYLNILLPLFDMFNEILFLGYLKT